MAIAAYWVPATALAGIDQTARAEIRGNIVSADGLTGVAGVSVWAANMDTSEIYTSTATAADGSYTLSNLPPGEYDLAVETTDGLMPADALVRTTPGQSTMVSIALKAVAAEDEEQKPGEGEKGEEPKADEGQGQQNPETPEQPEPEQKKKKKKGSGFWRSPAGATILIVAGAGAVAAAASSATDNNNEPPMTGSGN